MVKKEPICGLYTLLRVLMKKYTAIPTITIPAAIPITTCQLIEDPAVGTDAGTWSKDTGDFTPPPCSDLGGSAIGKKATEQPGEESATQLQA